MTNNELYEKKYRNSQPSTDFLRRFFEDVDQRYEALQEWRARARRIAKAVIARHRTDPNSRISINDAETIYWILADEENVYHRTGVEGLRDLEMVDMFNHARNQGTRSFPTSQFFQYAQYLLMTPDERRGEAAAWIKDLEDSGQIKRRAFDGEEENDTPHPF